MSSPRPPRGGGRGSETRRRRGVVFIIPSPSIHLLSFIFQPPPYFFLLPFFHPPPFPLCPSLVVARLLVAAKYHKFGLRFGRRWGGEGRRIRIKRTDCRKLVVESPTRSYFPSTPAYVFSFYPFFPSRLSWFYSRPLPPSRPSSRDATEEKGPRDRNRKILKGLERERAALRSPVCGRPRNCCILRA